MSYRRFRGLPTAGKNNAAPGIAACGSAVQERFEGVTMGVMPA